jgi:hypothetical protein
MQKPVPAFPALAPPLRFVPTTALAVRSFIVNADIRARCHSFLSIGSQNGIDLHAGKRTFFTQAQMLLRVVKLPHRKKFLHWTGTHSAH